jgi:hypothetical protein
MQTVNRVSSNMEFLKYIDWHNHDGVNLGMINDYMRNQFYDRILKNTVKDQNCTDIGFGTGLLSMLALKHGARHVRAFESDANRYLLGQEIIKRLGLENKISLFNERYTNSIDPTPVTFTETVNGNLWWEGLWTSLPRNNETVFLPGEYFLEIWAVTIPESFARGLCRVGSTHRSFNPGVDIDRTFIDTVNYLAGLADVPLEPELTPGIVIFERQQETDWGWVPYLRAAQTGSVVSSYSVGRHTESCTEFRLTVDTKNWHNQTVLIVPRAGMQHNTNKLYLDTGHWGPTESPILLHCPSGQFIIKHNIRDGAISYQLE